MRRTKVVKLLADLVGDGILEIEKLGRGWPALCRVTTATEVVPVAIFMSTVVLTHRDRDDTERRLQNPENYGAIELVDGRLNLLLGLWQKDTYEKISRPVLMAANAALREGKATRYSVFSKLEALKTAMVAGWAEAKNSSGENIYAFHPALLPTYVEMKRAGVHLSTDEMSSVIDASGLNLHDVGSPAERARRTSSSLVRSAKFVRLVVEAYGGQCAMCGLSLGLVQGAHIYPVSAPGSHDEPWNGVALCNNHHAAFDKHLIWVHPTSREIRIHDDIQSSKTKSQASQLFIDSTHQVLTEPSNTASRPKAEAFEQRYDFYGDERYGWARN